MRTYSDRKQFVSLYLLHSGLFPLYDDMKGNCPGILKYVRTIKIGKAKVYLYCRYSWHIKSTDENFIL